MQIYKNIDILFSIKMLIFLIFLPFLTFSQDDFGKIKENENLISQKLIIILGSDSDSLKTAANNEIISLFEEILSTEESFIYTFDTLKNNISIVWSDDDLLKIYTWGIISSDGTFRYYGFLQYKNKKKEQLTLFKLNDLSEEIKNPENQILTNDNWYGAVYYSIITKKIKKSKYYTLLGWDGNDDFTTKKIIDVVTLSSNSKPKFGSDFKLEEKSQKRIIFEYNAQAQMLLQYNDIMKMIVFDHLSPSNPKFEGNYRYYGPDFSYDGLYFENGVWIYIPDIDFRSSE